MELSEFEIDEVSFEQGEWVSDIPNFGDVRLRVRGLGNADARRLNAKLTAAVPSSKKVGSVVTDPTEQDRITSVLLTETCLLGWDKLTDKGQPLPYSKEKAFELISTRRLFREAVINAATTVGRNQAEQVDSNQGNSASGSSGT